MATAVYLWDALWGSIPMITIMSSSFVVGYDREGTPVWISCTFLFRATRGKVQPRSHSLESQSTGADGRHIVSQPRPDL